jgi:hypothetical protein
MNKPVSHPFRVGEIYANRNGEYEVIDISPPKMTIRYHSNNQLLVTDIALSARIWENLHLPPEVPEPPTRSRPLPKPTAASRAKAAAKPAATPRASTADKPPATPRAITSDKPPTPSRSRSRRPTTKE